MTVLGARYTSSDPGNVDCYIVDDAWSLQHKLDGVRVLISTDADGRATLMSHTGAPLRSGVRNHAAVARAVRDLRSCTLDGELMHDGTVWLFDVLRVLDTDTRLLAQSERRSLLDAMAPALAGSVVGIVAEATTTDAKRALWDRIVAEGAEGVVAKRRSARYPTTSKRTGDIVKLKRTTTIDCVVTGRNSDGHLNASLGLYDTTGRLVPVGRCSMLGKADAGVGDVIEVTFLAVYRDALSQPRMMRLRPDKAAAECTLDQLDGCVSNRNVLAHDVA